MSLIRHRDPTLDPRHAFTLPELLLALVLALSVTGTTMMLVKNQLALTRASLDIQRTQRLPHEATTILSAALRAAHDSLISASDTALEFRQTIGASVVCVVTPPQTITLPPDSLAANTFLTTMLTTPDSADEVAFYSPTGGRRVPITTVTRPATATACPPTTSFTAPLDVVAGRKAYAVTVATSLFASIHSGTPIRFFRHVRYSVYRASDGRWYLGYRRCDTGGCATVQPVSGPYASSGTTLPLTFRYYRSDGMEVVSPSPASRIARIDVVVRARTARLPHAPGIVDSVVVDSSVTTIALRNAP